MRGFGWPSTREGRIHSSEEVGSAESGILHCTETRIVQISRGRCKKRFHPLMYVYDVCVRSMCTKYVGMSSIPCRLEVPPAVFVHCILRTVQRYLDTNANIYISHSTRLFSQKDARFAETAWIKIVKRFYPGGAVSRHTAAAVSPLRKTVVGDEYWRGYQ